MQQAKSESTSLLRDSTVTVIMALTGNIKAANALFHPVLFKVDIIHGGTTWASPGSLVDKQMSSSSLDLPSLRMPVGWDHEICINKWLFQVSLKCADVLEAATGKETRSKVPQHLFVLELSMMVDTGI